MWCFLQDTQAHLSCSRFCFGGETSKLCLIMWSWFFLWSSFLWSPHRAVSQFLWLFPVPNWEIMLSGPLGSYREMGIQQHHPSGAIPSPGLLQGALKSTAVLRKLSLKIQGKGEREGKKMPCQRCLCLKDDQCFSGVNYICFYMSWKEDSWGKSQVLAASVLGVRMWLLFSSFHLL